MKRKILIVDDEAELTQFLVDALNAQNYEAFGALNRDQALGYLMKEKIEAILLDTIFPGGGAVDLIYEISNSIPYSPVVVFLTGQPLDKVKKLFSGNQIITKPINMPALLKCLESIDFGPTDAEREMLIKPSHFLTVKVRAKSKNQEIQAAVELVETLNQSIVVELSPKQGTLDSKITVNELLAIEVTSGDLGRIEIEGSCESVEKSPDNTLVVKLKLASVDQFLLKKLDQWYDQYQGKVAKFIRAAKN